MFRVWILGFLTVGCALPVSDSTSAEPEEDQTNQSALHLPNKNTAQPDCHTVISAIVNGVEIKSVVGCPEVEWEEYWDEPFEGMDPEVVYEEIVGE